MRSDQLGVSSRLKILAGVYAFIGLALWAGNELPHNLESSVSMISVAAGLFVFFLFMPDCDGSNKRLWIVGLGGFMIGFIGPFTLQFIEQGISWPLATLYGAGTALAAAIFSVLGPAAMVFAFVVFSMCVVEVCKDFFRKPPSTLRSLV